jgi:hypothetical protein
MARPSVWRCEFQQVESEYIRVCDRAFGALGTAAQRLFKPEIPAAKEFARGQQKAGRGGNQRPA